MQSEWENLKRLEPSIKFGVNSTGYRSYNDPDPTMLEVFLYYISERRNIWHLKTVQGLEPPWTQDKILREYKFTNVFRSNDRTTAHFFKNFYAPHNNYPVEQIALNCAIFRYFGTTTFADHIGWQSKFDPDELLKQAKLAIDMGKQIFTGAYVITNSGIKAPKEDVVINNFLADYNAHMPAIVKAIATNRKMEVHKVLKDIQGFGGTGFMAKEVMEDMALTPLLINAEDRMFYTPMGPGARRGLDRLYGQTSSDMLEMLDRVDYLRKCIGYHIKLSMTAHDVQFNICEYDKYVRVFNGEGRPRSRYKYKEAKGDLFNSVHKHSQ